MGKIQYNSPVILTFSLLCAGLFMIDNFLFGHTLTSNLFTLYPSHALHTLVGLPTLITYIFGHANAEHLMGNLSIVLLVGPAVEERIGSQRLLMLIGATALIGGLLQALFFREGLLGASGIVFMLMVLSSFANAKKGYIPLTFILVVVLFVGKEVLASFQHDQVSQFAHIIGGICGSIFGFTQTTNQQSV